MDTLNPSLIDLMDAETLDAISKSVQTAIDAKVKEMTQPMYPRWYREKDYPKPKPEEAYNHVKRLEGEFGALRSRIIQDYRTVRMETSGVYPGFEDDENEPFIDSGIASEVELISYQLADSELSFDAPATVIEDEDESERKIEFAIACHEDARRQHSFSGNGPLQLDKARTLLTTGRLVWHATLNLDADEGEMPFNEMMIDPATCYPVFEAKRGLRIMARTYTTTVSDVVGSFSTEENNLEYIYTNRNADGKFKRAYKDTDVVQVAEYWNRRWRIVWMDGMVVLGPVAHDYGFVPFVYKLGGLGMPAYVRDPGDMTASDIGNIRAGVTWSYRDVSHPNKGISLVHLLRAPHMLKESIMTKILAAFDTSIDPALLVEMDDVAYVQGAPEIDTGTHGRTAIKAGRQRVSPIPTNPSQQMLSPIITGVMDNVNRMMLPPTAHGLNDKSNVAGYATNSLNEAGLVKLVPHKHTFQEFEQECMEMRFKMYRDFGHLVRQGESGKQGQLMVPRTDIDPGEARAFLLTPLDLRTTGIKMKVSISSIPIQMLGPLGNALKGLMDAGLMDNVRALKILQDPNPHKTIKRIRIEKMLNDPRIMELEMVDALRSEGLHEQADYIMASGQSGGNAAPPADPMNGAMESPVSTVVGDSNAAYGMGPGPGSGPQGPIGPPPEMM